MKTQAYNGKLQIVERMKNSINGNPKYLVLVGDVTMYTMTDSMLAYAITNYDRKEVTVKAGLYRGKLTIDSIAISAK